MSRFFSVLKMDIRNLFLNPVLVGYNTIFPPLMIWIMGFLGGGEYANSNDAYQYYVISLLIFSMLNGAMTATNCFMERDIKGANLRIIYSPAGSFSIYFSKILASFLFDYSLHLLLVAVLCPVFHVSIGSQPVFFLILMAVVEFFSAALGIFFCCVLHSEEASSSLLSTVISLMCVVGGSFFSLDGMGGAMAFITRLSPVKWINDVFFAITCDNSYALFWPVLAGSVVVSAFLVLGCHLSFRTEDYL